MNTRIFEAPRGEPPAPSNFATVTAWADASLDPFVAREPHIPPRGRAAPLNAFRRVEDRQFLDMNAAFGARGGWVSGDEMSRRLRHRCNQPISVLASRIVRREMVSIVWRSRILIPVFQFSTAELDVRPVVRGVLSELEGVFDDWEIAHWFAQPNAWLGDQRPLDAAVRNDDAVIEAARADRFIARG